jgi:hypothetical protein
MRATVCAVVTANSAPSIHEVALGSAHRSGDKRAQEDLARMADELAALIIRRAVRLLPIEVIPGKRSRQAWIGWRTATSAARLPPKSERTRSVPQPSHVGDVEAAAAAR